VVAPGADVKLLSGLQQALQHTCAFQYDPRPDSYFGCPQSMLPAVVPDVEDHPLLEWLPYDCRCVGHALRESECCGHDSCKTTCMHCLAPRPLCMHC
jgi:hypothetical protein